MATRIDTEAALAKLAQLYEAEEKLVAKLREAGVGALRIAKVMRTSPQGIGKRFPVPPPVRAAGRAPAAPARARRTTAAPKRTATRRAITAKAAPARTTRASAAKRKTTLARASR